MMADVSSEETIHAGIKQWLADYIETKAQESTYDPKGLVNKTTDIKMVDLPKTSRVRFQEEEALKAEMEAKQSSETS